jgi:5-(carboxyamino)imidazole ribonucleotide synthase
MLRARQQILPGAALGVLGGGQLGRMFAQAAQQMGYQVIVYCPDPEAPAGQVANDFLCASYEDTNALSAFARRCAAVTLEFENIPVDSLRVIEAHTPVRPGPDVLFVTQDRLREKTFLSDKGFPVVPFVSVHSEKALHHALKTLGGPCILKTAGFGYDGKGQFKLQDDTQVADAWAAMTDQEAILEKYMAFACEVSVVGVRGMNGEFRAFPVTENRHRRQILDVSVVPARVPESVAAEAVAITQEILEWLQVVGVLCVEFFVMPDGGLIVNELAPRPHNSGHYSLDACLSSQFEQQVRALCGLPLGDPRLVVPAAAMVNLLGDLWSPAEPDWSVLLSQPSVKLHLYGKQLPRAGRKMGHFNVLGQSPEEVLAVADEARQQLMSTLR